MPTKVEIRLENPTLNAVLAIGYAYDNQRLTFLNSWGSSFGNDGYFYMPYDYIWNNKRTYGFQKIEEVSESRCCVS